MSEVVGTGAYLLVSDAAARMLDIAIDAATPITESYEHYAPIDTFAIALDTRAAV